MTSNLIKDAYLYYGSGDLIRLDNSVGPSLDVLMTQNTI
jgi:hypothetical protein